MKGFPKAIGTGQDLQNCLALLNAGQISKEDMQATIEQIESRGFIHCPALAVSDDRKTATIRYCSEVAAQQSVNGVEVVSVEHTNGEDETPETTTIRFKKPLPAGVTVLLIPSPVSPLDALGLSQAQFDGIKEALA